MGNPPILRGLLTQPTRSFVPLCATRSFESLIELYPRRRGKCRWDMTITRPRRPAAEFARGGEES